MFLFLKYIQPAWYYSLAQHSTSAILLNPANYTSAEQELLSPPAGYETELAKQMDLAWQALQKGFIPDPSTPRLPLQDLCVYDSADNYRFVQRYFGRARAFYILIIRILSLHNPIIEFWAFLRASGQPRIKLYDLHKKHEQFLTFESTLLLEKPFVSVVIPTLNRYPYLKNVLSDLESQTYQHFEVLVCDQSDNVDNSFYCGWNLNIKLMEQKEKALWLARNTCIYEAKGRYIALTEDDVTLPTDWLENHLKCLDYFNNSISCGIFYPEGKQPSISQSYFRLSEIFATGNTLIKKEVFEKTGLFDRQFEGQRMGDGEFGLRCFLNNEKLVLNPLAYCIDVKAPIGGLREMGSWDSLRTNKIFAPRPMPSVLYFIRHYFGKENTIMYIIQNVPYSFIPYQYRHSRYFKITAIVLFPVFLPLMTIVIIKSWREATKKLYQGPIVPRLS